MATKKTPTTKKTPAVKATKKASPKKASVKKTPAEKKEQAVAVEPTKEKKDRSTAPYPVTERRAMAITALKELKATNKTSAVSVATVAEKLGFTHFDVYHLIGSKRFPLVEDGFVALTGDGREKLCYLTAKKVDLTKAPFAKVSKKEA